MPYVTSWERIAKEQGVEIALQEGERKEATKLVLRQLRAKFGSVDAQTETRACLQTPP